MEEEVNGENLESDDPVLSAGNLMDSKTSHLDDALNEKLEDAFDQQTHQIVLHDVTKIASEHNPIDLAYAVTRLPPGSRIIVYENLPDLSAKVIFMINTGSGTRTAIFRQLSDDEIKQLISHMPPDEAVFVLDDISDRRLKRLLEKLDPQTAGRIRELQQHDRHSAGRVMTNEFFAFNLNTTIGEVAKNIRDNPGIALTRRVFVLNDSGELIGYVPERNLIVNSHKTPLRQVTLPILHKVSAETTRDEVVNLVERYKVPSLPVVDRDDKLLGVISYEDVVEILEDIKDETIATIAGTTEEVGENEPILKRFSGRAPWLLVTLLAGLLTASAMAMFYDRFWFAFVPFFVPLITGMSGNVGIQCSTILVRGMSTGELSAGSKNQAIRSELAIGLISGSVFGVTCGLVVYALSFTGFTIVNTNSAVAALTLSAGVFGACLTAAALGTFAPFFFARFRVDPAVASGPIVTAFNDLISTLMFIFVAWLVNTILIT